MYLSGDSGRGSLSISFNTKLTLLKSACIGDNLTLKNSDVGKGERRGEGG